MGTKQVSAEYLSVGANRQTSVADWSATGLLAFGADVNIALWRPTLCPPTGVENLLHGHKEAVKAVLFLPQDPSDGVSYLVSGSDDKTLIVWKSDDEERHRFQAVQTSSDHAAPVNCVTAVRVSDQPAKWIMATGAADATIKIWSLEDDRLRLLQSIKTTPKFFPLTMSLSAIDGHVLILAAAGTRETVQILTADLTTPAIDFSIQATLHGHEGWVRSLSFTREAGGQDGDLLLASSSQDKYIRIWRIHRGTELPALAASGSDPLSGAFLPGKSPSNKVHRLRAAGKDFSITFEALLLGHEDWIYSARWHTNAHGKPQLLSTSADNSLAIWEADPTSGIWVSMVRLGEISREKGATTATGSTGGFWTGLWSPDGNSVACMGRTGSWRRWERDPDTDAWEPRVAISGHTKAVTGVAWSKSGSYLLSTSLDQTSRLHTQWTATDAAGTWHEMARPQIHGYDLNCIDTLDDAQFVSGADEKLMRVFSKPRAVAVLLNRLASHGCDDVHKMPHAANMPVLGLSNKAIDAVDDDEEIQPIDDRDRDAVDPASVVKKSYLEIDHPPLEETLSRHTLWPETEKLYGHGYEISCLAASHDGKLVASACKASSTNHAVIRLFETERWTEIRPPLVAHSLTTTRLRFSGDDEYLLSVGRDRQWAVFKRDPGEDAMYTLLQSNPKGHSRMILDAAWAPSTSRRLFATAGRDKQVRIWAAKTTSDPGRPEFSQSAALSCSGPVTAVDFLPVDVDGSFVLAVGTEAGKISTWLLSEQGDSIAELEPPAEFSLPKAVLQLAWRPINAGVSTTFTLAVAGEDGSLRLFSFDKAYLRAP
ncbi:hypothetical protein E4U42_001407 [Claviceps africana]|uniref:Elongator complex protein 2 n=1 Tax=Claviceps africana TaxID=83212 RepID=A0A8K0J9V3_9HYPO|nr:hypothetical protein E4U42_001407 [Claviceps africana]